MELRHEVPEGGEDRVAELYWEAFGRKLGAALGPAPPGAPSSPRTCTGTGP